MDYVVWIYSWIPDIQYGIQAVRQVWAIYVLETRFQNSGVKTLKRAPMIQRRVNKGFCKGYSKQVGLIMNIENDLRSLQFHIVGMALALAWEGKILGLESKDKLQPVSQWSWWYIILCCEKHSPRYRNLDKDDPVKKLKDQGNVQPIKLTRVVWRMFDFQRAVNTFLAKLERGL